VLYWLTNNILSIAQQWIINTRMGVPPQFNLPKFRWSRRPGTPGPPANANGRSAAVVVFGTMLGYYMIR